MYCKAGFKHFDIADCEHIVTVPVSQPQPARSVFKLPEDFYSPEATAARREANKAKYGPLRGTGRHQGRILEPVNRGEA